MKVVKDISELHTFLSFGQPEGNVGITLLDLMEQGDNEVKAFGKTDKADGIVVSTTSTQLLDGGRNGHSGGNIAFRR